MKKMFFMAAVAALALSSCSSDDLVQAPEVNGAEDGAVSFSAYAGRANRTTNNATLNLAKDGFGVFAYEQGTSDWKNYVTSYNVPNFMYNQRVLGYKETACTNVINPSSDTEVAAWGYSPVKYFSNVPDAKHTFFAYAPWKSDINVKFSTTGPKIHYAMADNYDLLWGRKTIAGNPATYIDLKKQDVAYKLDFTFEHMLTQIKVDLAYFSDVIHTDADHSATSEDLADGTKIIVRSVKLAGPIATEGELDLATGNWVYTNVDETAFEKSDIVFVGGVDKASDSPKTAFDNLKILPPMNGQSVKIKVVYDVETIDENDKTGLNNHIVTNTWTSDELTLLKGHSYTYHLHIGMTSVKFNAEVSEDWKNETEENIDLPVINLYPGFTPVEAASIITDMNQAATDPTPANEGDIYWKTADHKVRTYTSDTWGDYTGSEYNDKYIKDVVDGEWYKIATATGTAVTKIFFNPKDGKYYENYDEENDTYNTVATPTATQVYVIGGNLYTKNS